MLFFTLLYEKHPVLTSLDPTFLEIERMFLDPHVSLGCIKVELNKLYERIQIFSDLMDEVTHQAVDDYYTLLQFCYLACIAYYGGGNLNAIQNLAIAKYN